MNNIEFFNNFNLDSPQFFENQFSVYCLYFLSTIAINVAAYLFVVVRFYKVLCYSTMTFEWLPMINPYIWPFSIFKVLTEPYFDFWSKVLPMVKFEDSSLEISGIIALEGLNSCTFFLVRVATLLIPVLEKTRMYISEIPN
jgi:uncharacterized protein YggT (Ycf19 family)|tara:strand:+ start:246 stop:668 length:423 start_codon:yes stop_codon:yes gene_type:complete